MAALAEPDNPDLLTHWIGQTRPAVRSRRGPPDECGGLRFAFYGRVSTADFQERVSSRRWQRDAAEDLVAGHGRIVVEFFDADRSRRLRWADRPQAAKLLQALTDPGRGFDAVVVGEYERAFCGDQALTVLPLLDACGVRLWLPEALGPVDLAEPVHQALVMLLGAQSKREVQRARFRALAAMRAQTRDEGRFLGGRPLYGYRLVDAGPHPNPMHAKWGRRLQRYDPDPATAPTVRWIFAQRLLGWSVSSIAAELNRTGVPCPSQADPGRNRHRAGSGWGLTTVQAILSNAKYTGRQVWNRQPAYHTPAHLPGPFRTQRWADADQWVVSTKMVHPALVSEADFIAVQELVSTAARSGPTRRYQLAGLLRCGRCGRLLDSCWSHGRAAYRCRHGYTSARPQRGGRARNLYVREDRILAIVRDLLGLASAGSTAAALVEHLRRERLIVSCGETVCSLEPM
jgi:DNA invertase Pin-like site-specific DNA recombinase